MTVNRAWVKRNIGFDPVAVPPPAATFAFEPANATRPRARDIQREIIDFDSEGPEGQAFLAFSTSTGLSRFTDIPWPAGTAPKTDAKVRRGKAGALPRADVLIVTWTVDEGHAISRVLTPGKDSRNDYVDYRHNFRKIAARMRKGCPALEAGRLGAYWTGRIGTKTIVVFKSDSHLSQDTKTLPTSGGMLPNVDVWMQIINEVNPSLVITTGTAGGIGPDCEVGDVVVSPIVRFDSQKWLRHAAFAKAVYKDAPPHTNRFAIARKLFSANIDQLPTDNSRAPTIILARADSKSVVTTDFFGFDTSDNRFKLQTLGAVSEMGDAVLGLVAQSMGARAPRWVAVRNVSDPQIKAEGTPGDQAKIAAQIYKAFGRWSSVCSAIVCWALIS